MDSEVQPSWRDLEGDCEAPGELAPDPLTLQQQIVLGEGEYQEYFVEFLDVDVDWENQRAWLVGQGGLNGFSFAGDEFTPLGRYEENGRFHRVRVLREDRVLVVDNFQGFKVVNTSDPDAPELLSALTVSSGSGLALLDEWVFLTTYEGDLRVYTLDRAGALRRGHHGLWALQPLEHQPQRRRQLGLRGRQQPGPGAGGSAGSQRADRHAGRHRGRSPGCGRGGGYAYVATGEEGIEIFSLADPEQPVSVARVDYGAAVVGVEATEDWVWGVNHEDVVVVDVSDPEQPLPWAAQQTTEWSMTLAARGDEAIVGDWGNVDRYVVDRSLQAPEADLSRSEIYFGGGDETVSLSLANLGSAGLEVVGGGIEDPRFTVQIDRERIRAGESAQLEIRFEDDGEEIRGSLCLATSDPDEPVVTVPLSRSSDTGSSIAVGEPAVDFALQDLDGRTWQLSEQLGHPVVLIYFATW